MTEVHGSPQPIPRVIPSELAAHLPRHRPQILIGCATVGYAAAVQCNLVMS